MTAGSPALGNEPSLVGFWRIATADPDRVAIVDGRGSETFGELLTASRRVGHALRALGLEPGDHVAMALPNEREFLEVLLAAMEIGLVVTPLNNHLAAAEVAHVLSDSDAQVFFAHEAIAEVAQTAASDAGHRPRALLRGRADRRLRRLRLADVRARDEVRPSRLAGSLMMYTSGTTGKPKGVRRSQPVADPDELFGEMAALTCRGFGVPVRAHSHLVCGPLYHAGPFVGATTALHVGATLVLMDRWSPERCLELIERHHVESTQMVPTMFHRLLALPPKVSEAADVSSIKSVFHTGAPCPEHVKARMMEWFGPVVYETYGGTEGAATIATPRRWLARPGTVGKAIRGTTVRILDADGNELGPGEVGEIWIESEAGPSEYYKDPGKSAAMRRGRMITLGDVGLLDEDGYLFLRDRKIDMIISGGVNIYPAEVEAALLADEAIADATVIGIPDGEWGEQVKAIVELRPGTPPSRETEQEILERCRSRIARFKCPKSIDFVDALPRLPNGKVEKRRLRDPYWADRSVADLTGTQEQTWLKPPPSEAFGCRPTSVGRCSRAPSTARSRPSSRTVGRSPSPCGSSSSTGGSTSPPGKEGRPDPQRRTVLVPGRRRVAVGGAAGGPRGVHRSGHRAGRRVGRAHPRGDGGQVRGLSRRTREDADGITGGLPVRRRSHHRARARQGAQLGQPPDDEHVSTAPDDVLVHRAGPSSR